MSTIDQVIELLNGDGTPFRVCSGAAGMAAAQLRGPNATPAAFVFFGKEASGDNQRTTGPVMQRQERDLSVVIVIDNASDAIGAAGADALETIKIWVRDQLLGVVLDDAAGNEPVTHVEGAVADFKHGSVWYEDVFSAPTYIKEKAA